MRTLTGALIHTFYRNRPNRGVRRTDTPVNYAPTPQFTSPVNRPLLLAHVGAVAGRARAGRPQK